MTEGTVLGSPRLADPGQLEVVILTGMSGAGRSTTAKVLEDRGWYVVDNLPPQMILPMAEFAGQASGGTEVVTRLAAVVDVRSRSFFRAFRDALAVLHDTGWHPTVIFVDATDEVLVRRFESVRRPHPLQGDGGLLDGITLERELLGDLRATADLMIDTSNLTVHQLAARVDDILGSGSAPQLRVAIMSFGFKYGVPLDADMVLDMRFLPNPYWNLELRPLSGLDPPVRDFVLAQPGALEVLDRTVGLLDAIVAGYLREGRRYVTVALGCTGGKHRSIAMATELARRMGTAEVATIVAHRDLGRE